MVPEHGTHATSWALATQSLARPYRVPAVMLVFFALVPLYVLVPALFPPDVRYRPELPLDRMLPLVPAWSLIYGAPYALLILLPAFVVRHEELIRRTLHAYLFIWLVSYAFFFAIYPTLAPRPPLITGEGFAVWGLRGLYGADPPNNCFPSLHVAHSFVSALAVGRVHRRLGNWSLAAAAVVAASTLFTKQHYVLDVVAGIALAAVAHRWFLRPFASARVTELDRRAAPALAGVTIAIVGVGLIGFWLVYLWQGETRFEFGP